MNHYDSYSRSVQDQRLRAQLAPNTQGIRTRGSGKRIVALSIGARADVAATALEPDHLIRNGIQIPVRYRTAQRDGRNECHRLEGIDRNRNTTHAKGTETGGCGSRLAKLKTVRRRRRSRPVAPELSGLRGHW